MRRAVLLVGLGLVAVAVFSMTRTGDSPRPLTVGWGGSEGHPACLYDAAAHSVDVTLVVDGTAPHGVVTVTVTAFADENTSDPVGSTTQTWRGSRAHHRTVVLTIPVTRAPHVDEVGEGACRLSVSR